MKTIMTYFLAVVFLFSIGLNISNFLRTTGLKPSGQSLTTEQSFVLSHSDNTSEMLARNLEEIKVILMQQEERQTLSEEVLRDLMSSFSQNQYENHITSVKANATSEDEMRQMPKYEFESIEMDVENKIYSGHWTVENAMELIRDNAQMSHQQRTQLQLKIVQAINAGILRPETLEYPLF